MSYRVVYDVRQHGDGIWSHVVPLVAVFAALLIVGGLFPQLVVWLRIVFDKRPMSLAATRATWVALGGAGLLLMCVILGLDASSRWKLERALDGGHFTLVQGTVTHFAAGDSVRRVAESFDVNGHRYTFEPYLRTMGYNGAPGGRDVVGEGSRVRITDVDGLIARLEVAQ